MSPSNRLASSTSPYLLQHAHNPVAWQPWDEAALRLARETDRPIFLSIGYSACHWCHVMAHESFEDPQVAAVLNGFFVPVKVDREERPDLDDLYMGAVHAIAGRGGWPMSVWLTPDLKPFYGGTYFPLEPRFGFPGFVQLLRSIAEAWRTRRPALEADADRLAEAMARQAQLEPGTGLPSARLAEEVLVQLRRTFDPEWGGFGPAPKFPPFLALGLLLQQEGGDRKMALRTLDAMAEGGMFDQLGGGFSRYSVDTQWLVPHFEKMLYDNAELACTYLAAFQATGRQDYAGVARATLDYLLRDLRDPAGGFHSSEDADSEGEEGRFYTFTPAEVEAVLGEADGKRFCATFGVTAGGNFEGGRSVPNRLVPEAADPEALGPLRERMFQARQQRVRPHRDDKVLAAWNGLALSAFARGWQVLGDERYLAAAVDCARFLRRELWRDGILYRTWRKGVAHTPAFLEDYGAVALGLADLHEATLDSDWLTWAEALLQAMGERFEDRGEGGYFSTAEGQGDVLLRQKPVFDQSIPSANALAVLALYRVGCALGRQDFLAGAERALASFAPILEQAARACLGLLEALDWAVHGPVEIKVAGPRDDPRTRALLQAAWSRHLPRRVLSLAEAREISAQVCIDRACLKPVDTPEALLALLSKRQF